MKEVSLCILRRSNPQDEVLIGKIVNNDFQGDVHNFPGGKRKEGETSEKCACRELYEETGGVEVNPADLEKIAELTFLWPESKAKNNQVVRVYLSRVWRGDPHPTKELIPYWCPVSSMPYDKMWEADKHWVPRALKGKYFTATFRYNEEKKLLEKSFS